MRRTIGSKWRPTWRTGGSHHPGHVGSSGSGRGRRKRKRRRQERGNSARVDSKARQDSGH